MKKKVLIFLIPATLIVCLNLFYFSTYTNVLNQVQIRNFSGYKIPYNDIKNLIDTNGSLWKAFKTCK